jgi:DNA-binding response OmpR family regulator
MRRILILADDDEALRESVATLLQELGWEVLTAGDAVEAAVLYAQNNHVRHILTDLNMGGRHRNGDALYRAVRGELERRNGTLGIMTGLPNTAEMLPLQAAGVPLLAKPFRATVLSSFLEAHFH